MAFAMGTPLVDPVAMAKLGLNQTADIAGSAQYPGIRVMTVGDIPSTYPMSDFANNSIHQRWARASPASIGSAPDVMGSGHFSAVCYYYGRGVYDELKRIGKETPIGLLHASWGGSSVEDWMDFETLAPPTGGICPGPIGNGCCGAKAMQQYNGEYSNYSPSPPSLLFSFTQLSVLPRPPLPPPRAVAIDPEKFYILRFCALRMYSPIPTNACQHAIPLPPSLSPHLAHVILVHLWRQV